MKKLFFAVLFGVIISFVPEGVLAQSQSCSVVTANNYASCCGGAQNGSACADYCDINPTDGQCKQGIPGQVTGTPGVTRGSPLPQIVNTSSGGVSVAPFGAVSGPNYPANPNSCFAIKFKTLVDVLLWAKCIITDILIPVIFALAFLVFLWGVFRFISETEQKNKEEHKKFIYYGLIGLFVMFGVWGIIEIVATTFGIDAGVPLLQTEGSILKTK